MELREILEELLAVLLQLLGVRLGNVAAEPTSTSAVNRLWPLLITVVAVVLVGVALAMPRVHMGTRTKILAGVVLGAIVLAGASTLLFGISPQAVGLVLDILGIVLIGGPFVWRWPDAGSMAEAAENTASALADFDRQTTQDLEAAAREEDARGFAIVARRITEFSTGYTQAAQAGLESRLGPFEVRTAEAAEFVAAGTLLAVAGFVYQISAIFS